MMSMQALIVMVLSTTLMASSTVVNAEDQLSQMEAMVEGVIDKLMNVRLWNQQLSNNGTSNMEVNDLVISNHNLYCASGAALKDQSCQLSDPNLENADVQVSSILAVPLIPDDGDKGRNWAAQVFSRNMVSSNQLKFNDFTLAEVTRGNEKYDSKKATQYAEGLLAAAVMSIPTLTFAELYASRKMGEYKDVQNPDPQPSSLIGYMEQISNRTRDTKWVDEVLKAKDPIVIQKKQALMQAEQLFIDYQKYKQGERIEALLSAIVVQNQRQAEAAANLLAQTKPVSATGGMP